MIVHPIGHIKTPFKEKFGVPRQPGLTPSIEGVIEFLDEYSSPELFDQLENFEYLILIFHFHQVQKWKPMVKPPRLGGNQKVGVYSTRSPFRPNNIGLSIVKLKKIILEDSKVSLLVESPDLVHDTPIIDIKPYIPKWDSFPNAKAGWFDSLEEKKLLDVCFTDKATAQLKKYNINKDQIIEILRENPAPAYHSEKTNRLYRTKFKEVEVSWKLKLGKIQVTEIIDISFS